MSLTPIDEIEARIRRAVSRWTSSPVLNILPLTPDASSRRYFRILLDAPDPSGVKSAVAMWFDSVASPEAAGGLLVDADEAYVELTKFFRTHHVAVPALYADARSEKLLIIEDLGDTQLFSVLARKGAQPAELRSLLFQAIDQLLLIQSLSPQADFFPFQRRFTAELYRREMGEFEEFLFHPSVPGAPERVALAALMDHVAVALDGEERVLVHRDFHAWNLLVDGAGKVRVIDFQDALMATKPYDLASLLNDRDMDTLLGTALYKAAVGYFIEAGKFSAAMLELYDRVLLQRDLKVAGRFAKLAQVRGLKQYAAWIPGTLKRIGRTLERLTVQAPGAYSDALSILATRFPDCQAGAESPLRWDDLKRS